MTINLKILCQVLWTRKIDWDVPLVDDFKETYTAAMENLRHADLIKVERCLFPENQRGLVRECHIFADASLKAYGCVAYLRECSGRESGKEVSVRFIFSKARVTPLKGKYPIHRLELLAAVLAARVGKLILQAVPEKIHSTFYYTDNSARLGWIKDRLDRWKLFVSNRIKEIQELTDPESWSYVRSEENPADLLSRGPPLDTDELRRFWLHGPHWLSSLQKPSPHSLNRPLIDQESLVEKKAEVTAAVVVESPVSRMLHKEYSTWSKAVRIVSYVLRFTSKTGKSKESRVTDAEEYRAAEDEIFKNIQRIHFPSEVESGGMNITKTSRLYQLNPFMGEDGFLRCRSRLVKSANISYDEKCPILLPGDDFYVDLFLRWIHIFHNEHSGSTSLILQNLRSRFFVLNARRAAKKAYKGCKICARYRAKQAIEPAPPLPAFRIEECAPFASTGLDFLGPIFIKNENGDRVKSWILLMTCAVTRAIRLELVRNLSTEEFLLAFRRFISRNPGVEMIRSDNAKTFKRAEIELNILFEHAKKPEVQEFFTRKKIQWTYSTEKAPWHGSFFERQVQNVKKPLRKCLGTRALAFRELETVLTEIEKVVNDRPISAVIVDPSEPKALSPSNLLYGYASQPGLPDMRRILRDCEEANAIVFSERWKRQQSVLRGSRKQYQTTYLQFLRSAHYSKPTQSRPLRPGDVCILQSSEPSRAYWPLGVVRSVFGGEGTDRRKRSCVIQLTTGQLLRRPIQLVYPLEIAQF